MLQCPQGWIFINRVHFCVSIFSVLCILHIFFKHALKTTLPKKECSHDNIFILQQEKQWKYDLRRGHIVAGLFIFLLNFNFNGKIVEVTLLWWLINVMFGGTVQMLGHVKARYSLTNWIKNRCSSFCLRIAYIKRGMIITITTHLVEL